MNDDVWLNLLEQAAQRIEIRHVPVKVADIIGFWSAVASRADVDYGDGAGVALDELVDDVVAEEAAAADNDDVSEFFLDGWGDLVRHCDERGGSIGELECGVDVEGYSIISVSGEMKVREPAGLWLYP